MQVGGVWEKENTVRIRDSGFDYDYWNWKLILINFWFVCVCVCVCTNVSLYLLRLKKLAIAARQVTLCCVSQESIFLLMIKSIEIWHRLVGTCLSHFSQFLPSWLAVGGFITWLVSVTWWRWAFSRASIEGADYDACRSFQQILTWKQWENNPTAHSSFLPYWLLHPPTPYRTDAHTQKHNAPTVYGHFHKFTHLHCVHTKMPRNQSSQLMVSHQLHRVHPSSISY